MIGVYRKIALLFPLVGAFSGCVMFDPLVGVWNATMVMGETFPREGVGENPDCVYYEDGRTLTINEELRGYLERDGVADCGDGPSELSAIGFTIEKWPPDYKMWYTDFPDWILECALEEDVLTCTDWEGRSWAFERIE